MCKAEGERGNLTSLDLELFTVDLTMILSYANLTVKAIIPYCEHVGQSDRGFPAVSLVD